MNIATIRANDEQNGELIIISIIAYEYDGEIGFALKASNGDDIAHCRPQSAEKCQQDAIAMWGNWATFSRL